MLRANRPRRLRTTDEDDAHDPAFPPRRRAAPPRLLAQRSPVRRPAARRLRGGRAPRRPDRRPRRGRDHGAGGARGVRVLLRALRLRVRGRLRGDLGRHDHAERRRAHLRIRTLRGERPRGRWIRRPRGRRGRSADREHDRAHDLRGAAGGRRAGDVLAREPDDGGGHGPRHRRALRDRPAPHDRGVGDRPGGGAARGGRRDRVGCGRRDTVALRVSSGARGRDAGRGHRGGRAGRGRGRGLRDGPLGRGHAVVRRGRALRARPRTTPRTPRWPR